MKYIYSIIATLAVLFSSPQVSARCIADFSYSLQGSTFTFYDSSYTVNGKISHWDFGDGTSAIGDVVTHIYRTQDTFEVCLVVEDTVTNCLDTMCQFVTNVSSGGGSNGSGCNLGFLWSPTAADPYTYTFVNLSTGPSSYKWLFPNGDTSTAQRPIYDFDTSGTYEVCLVGYDSSGNSCDTVCRNVVIQTSGGNNCDARFTVSSRGLVNTFFSNASGRAVKWNFGDGKSSTLPTPIHIYDTLGTYTVCLYVYDSTANGVVICDSSCQTITLAGSGNTCDASFTYTSQGLVNTFFSNAQGRKVRWTFGDGDTSDRTSPIHIYDTLGTYTVCLYVYDSTANGLVICDSNCQTITLGGSGGSGCNASYTFSVDSANSQTIHFNNTSSGSAYVWNFGDGNTDSTQNPSHTYNSTGRFFVCLYVYDSTASGLAICDSVCQTIVISTPPVQCNASFYIGLDTSSKYNIYIVNNSTGTNSTTSYLWTFGDGDSSTQKNPTHQYDTFGSYNLCLTIVTRSLVGTCTSTHCDTIGMDSNGMLLKTGAFGITVIDESDLLNVEQIENINKLSVYPNPTRGQFSVGLNTKRSSDVNLTVMNSFGQLVLETSERVILGDNILDVDISNSPSGLYFVRVEMDNEVKVIRLVLTD